MNSIKRENHNVPCFLYCGPVLGLSNECVPCLSHCTSISTFHNVIILAIVLAGVVGVVGVVGVATATVAVCCRCPLLPV